MISFGALKYFRSIIKKLKKIIVLYQPRDLYLCIEYLLGEPPLAVCVP